MSGFDYNDATLQLTGSQLGSPDGRGRQTPVHVCALLNFSVLLDKLLVNGGQLDAKDSGDYTPLFVACRHGSLASCRCLLDHGALPGQTDQTAIYADGFSRSPLYAVCNLAPSSPSNNIIVELLLKAGLNVHKEIWLNENSHCHKLIPKQLKS